jgi:hypothetical protein
LTLASQLDEKVLLYQTHLLFHGRDSTQVLTSELTLSWKVHVFRRSQKLSSHIFSLSNSPLQQVSQAFNLQFQKPVPSPNGGKLFLDGRPLCCSSGDSAPLPLKLYGQIPLGVGLRALERTSCTKFQVS